MPSLIHVRKVLPGSFGRGILIVHSRNEGAQTCVLMGAKNKAAFD